jgi:hypothetical protein
MGMPGNQPSPLPRSAPELVVVLKPGSAAYDALVRGSAPAASSLEVSDLQSTLARSGAAMRPLFPAPEGSPAVQGNIAATRSREGDDLSRYFHVAAP